ncbi:hypothetical protein BT96DRAFT_1002950 [Gymnopus androsaceus JB14]|uniref:AN1-type domain-containing protein n=1 Tax=Gymnopus androsaceus JB14 TaxID=1447944 RepID=A0A6A4GVE9_9AGAR|nr:hypothetical protein BT96DRAFT_1002950 [Gymnopus androsaceus JB14]
MSGLLNVGNRCSVCSQIDFLPIPCPSCQSTFCKDHIRAEDHSCPAAKRSDLSESSTKLQKCALDGCKNPSLNAYGSLSGKPTCTSCQGSFCVEHREPSLHNCSPTETSLPTKNETARALLAKNFSDATRPNASVKRRIGKPPTDPTKLAQLELMKMRQRASALDPKQQKSSIPADKRRFFKASMREKPTRDLWIEQSLSTGKAFDLLATLFGISNDETDKYQLCKMSDNAEQPVPLQYDKPLADQVEDCEELMISSA